MLSKLVEYNSFKSVHQTSKNAIWTLFWVLYGSYIHTRSQPVSKRAIINYWTAHSADTWRTKSAFCQLASLPSSQSWLRAPWRPIRHQGWNEGCIHVIYHPYPPYECLRGGGKPWSCLSATLCFDGIASDHAYSPLPRHKSLEGLSHIASPTDAMKTNPICSMISFARAIQPATLWSTQTKRCKMRALFEVIFGFFFCKRPLCLCLKRLYYWVINPNSSQNVWKLSQ